MDFKIKSKATDELFNAILKLRNIEECYMFFEDLCTFNEVHSIAQRFEVAKKLSYGETYQKIEADTGASTATISRINRCLTFGANGYKLLIDRCSEDARK